MRRLIQILFIFFLWVTTSYVNATLVFANIEAGGTNAAGKLSLWKTPEGKLVWQIADDVAKGGKILDDIVDEVKFAELVKDIKYLPGPQLPQKIAETFENAIYTNRKLTVNERLFKYHGIDNRTGKKYSWFSNEKYTTEVELRQKLAIRDDWGVQIEYVTEFDIPSGTWLSEGKAASQGIGYPGGDYQAVITNTPNAWIIRTDKAFK